MVLVFIAVYENPAVSLIHPSVKCSQGLDCATDVYLTYAQVTETAESRGDIERNISVAAIAGETGP